MPQRITLLRFPDGDREYRTTEVHLRVGSRIRTRGQDWVIASVTDGLAVLAYPRLDGDGAAESHPAPPATRSGPTPAADEPIVLDALEAI